MNQEMMLEKENYLAFVQMNDQELLYDNEVVIDSAGELYDGTKMDGPTGLRSALLKHKDAFLQSFTENLMTYALGRRVEYYDMPAIRQIVRDAARNDYRMSAFFLSVVKSPAFQMSAADAAERTSTTTERHER